MKVDQINVFNRVGILTKLIILSIIPVIAIAFMYYYSADVMNRTTNKLKSALYDEAYQGVGEILNADRDLYQSYIGFLFLGTTQVNNPVEMVHENIAQVHDRVGRSKQIYDSNRSFFEGITSEDNQSIFDYYNEFDVRFAEYVAIVEQTIQSGGTSAAVLSNATGVFELAREQLNAIQDLVEIATVQTIDEQMAEKEAALSVSLIIMIAIAMLTFTLAALIVRSISQSLRQVVSRSERIAEGELAGEELHVRTNDMIGKLALSSNHMKRELTGVIGRIKAESEQLAATAEELSVSSEETARSTEQITLTIQEIASGTEQQVTAVEQSRMVAVDMADWVRKISENVERTAQSSQQAATIASDGNATVEQAISRMRLLDGKVRHAAEIMEQLETKSQHIDEILGMLNEISGQTNLLALNASIEAAKAGEHGRGFGVVAIEVRKLAERSQASSGDIQALIQEVQVEIARLAQSLADGLSAAEEGMHAVDVTGQAFRSIVGSIDEVADQMSAVSERSVQIQQGTGQMVDAMERVALLTEQFAGNTQTVAAASEEQNAAMEEIGSASQVLARMAEDLLQAVSKFKL